MPADEMEPLSAGMLWQQGSPVEGSTHLQQTMQDEDKNETNKSAWRPELLTSWRTHQAASASPPHAAHTVAQWYPPCCPELPLPATSQEPCSAKRLLKNVNSGYSPSRACPCRPHASNLTFISLPAAVQILLHIPLANCSGAANQRRGHMGEASDMPSTRIAFLEGCLHHLS